jgi:hypothetical protein
MCIFFRKDVSGQNHDSYNTSSGPPQHPHQHAQHRMADDRERKLPRPIGTERALTRRTPGPPHAAGAGQAVGFSPADLGLWGYHGAPSGAEMGGGPVVPMNPSTLPPGLNPNDWMSMSMSGLHGPNVSVPAPNSSDDGGLSYMQKQQQQNMPQSHHHNHHHHSYMQRQMEGIADGSGGESLEMQFSAQSSGGMNGGGPNSNAAAYHHPGPAFLNGMPPPGIQG